MLSVSPDEPFLMARSMLSLGMLSARALATARRRRGFMFGSGRPVLAATVMSRLSLENSLERAASWRPFLCMMFLNLEWPAMVLLGAGGGPALGRGLVADPVRNRQSSSLLFR